MQRNAHFLVFRFHFSQIKLGWKRWDLTSQQQMQQTDSIWIFKIFHSGCWPWSSYWRAASISIDVWKWWRHKYEGALLEGLNQWPLDQYLLTKFDFLLESNGQHMSFLRWSVLSISRSPQSDRLVSSFYRQPSSVTEVVRPKDDGYHLEEMHALTCQWAVSQ